MAVIKEVPDANRFPFVAASYHFITVPVALRLPTVAASQNACAAVPVGAAGLAVMVTVTANRVALSQPLIVWEA